MQAINSRASLPVDMRSIKQQFKIEYRTLFSTNPKTEKSQIKTYILHLAPHNTSGINVCPGAGNCQRICLHFAGNPVYMTNKQAARVRRTLAYASDPKTFTRLIVLAVLDKITKHKGEPLAFRLNGTSDILYEEIDFTITPEFAAFCRIKFGAILPIGKRNIFEVFNFLRDNTGENVVFYDYTKIRRNWQECRRLGYHLTFSFDGWSNKANLKLCKEALNNGVNVAAAFNIKRNQELPQYVNAALIFGDNPEFNGRVLYVQDGDLTDFRPSDTQGGSIIGLRFKLPHGAQWTEADRQAFCLA